MAAENSENKAGKENAKADKQSKRKKSPKAKSAAAETGADAQKPKRTTTSKRQTGRKSKAPRTSTGKKTPRKKDATDVSAPKSDEPLEPAPAGDSVEDVRHEPEGAAGADSPKTDSAPGPEPETPVQETTGEAIDSEQPHTPAQESPAPETPPAPAASEPTPPDTVPEPPRPSEPLPGIIKLFIVGFIVLIALIVITSYQNMQKYFVVAQHGAVEIWKGKFSPMGRKMVVIMPGVLPPADEKEVYTREDVFPLIFQYYINKADTLMEVPGAPDFIDIENYLQRAMDHAVTDDMRATVKVKLDDIHRTVLLYKADVAAAKETIADLESAREYLNQAAALNPDEPESNLIQHKMEAVEKQIAALAPDQKEQPPEATPPETPEVSSETPLQEKPPEDKEQTF